MEFWPQIQQLSSQVNLLPELRAQLAKDLALDNHAIPEESLLSWLSTWVSEEWNHQDWAQLFYRIDLNLTSAERPEDIAQSILEREAQKVIFRAQYSGRI